MRTANSKGAKRRTGNEQCVADDGADPPSLAEQRGHAARFRGQVHAVQQRSELNKQNEQREAEAGVRGRGLAIDPGIGALNKHKQQIYEKMNTLHQQQTCTMYVAFGGAPSVHRIMYTTIKNTHSDIERTSSPSLCVIGKQINQQ